MGTFQFGLERHFRARVGFDGFLDPPQFGFESSQLFHVENEVQKKSRPPRKHGRFQVSTGRFRKEFQFGQNEQIVEEPITEEPDSHSQAQDHVGSVEAGRGIFEQIFGLFYRRFGNDPQNFRIFRKRVNKNSRIWINGNARNKISYSGFYRFH